MKENKFRNHFSIVLEKLGLVFLSLFFLVVTEGIELIEELMKEGVSLTDGLLAVAVFFAIFFIAFLWQVRIWARTWISIEDDIITIERKTMLSKKNSIGIKNISNVNTEQNIFEMILGTCKVKLDTNSLSTANETDVKIILKKSEAEQLKKQLLQRINEINVGEIQEEVLDEIQEYDVEAEYQEVFMNGIYSVNLVTILILVSSIFGIMEVVKQGIHSGTILNGILSGLAGVVTLFGLVFVTVSSLVKGFIQMYGFRATRENDRIYLNYGLLRKVNYTIPVDKINGIYIKQTLIARICHRYSVELINVGMSDDEKTAVSFIFYTKREKVEEVMAKLLPEFVGILDLDMEKQPKKIWIMKAIGLLIFAGVLTLGGGILYSFCSSLSIIRYYGIVSVGIFIFTVLMNILGYFATGSYVRDDAIGIKKGAFGKHYVFMRYNKMQYVKFEQNFITKKLGICKGKVTLLAALQFQNQELPYMKVENMDVIEKGLIRKRT